MQHNSFLWWVILVAIYLAGINLFRRFNSIASNYLFYTNMGLNPDANTLWRSIKHINNKSYATDIFSVSKVSLLEAVSASFFATSLVLLYWHYGLSWHFVFNGLFVALIILLSYIDRYSFLLPDALVVPLIIVGLIRAIIYLPWQGIYNSILGFLVGYLILYILNAIWGFIYGVRGFGAGDLKMLGGIGMWLGASAIPFVLFIACVTNAAFAMIKQGSLKPKGCYAFGPFIAIGAIVTLIYSKYVLI